MIIQIDLKVLKSIKISSYWMNRVTLAWGKGYCRNRFLWLCNLHFSRDQLQHSVKVWWDMLVSKQAFIGEFMDHFLRLFFFFIDFNIVRQLFYPYTFPDFHYYFQRILLEKYFVTKIFFFINNDRRKSHDKVNKTMTSIHWYPVILVDTDILLYLLINTTSLEICSMFSKKQNQPKSC